MPASPLYAHTVRDRDESTWEPLADHLYAVAGRAAAFAAPFGCAEPARAMGLLHDLGKAAPAFQAYIRGTGKSPDHSAAGAVLAVERYGRTDGRLLAFGIAGHHAGLANASRPGAGPTPLKDRLKGTAAPRLPAGIDPPAADAVGKALAARRRDPDSAPLAASLLGRMLFSCLVDADYLETERFYRSQDGGEVERGSPLTPAMLRDRLAPRLAAMRPAPDRPLSPVNALRARVLDAVVAQAALPPGLFSLTVPTGGGKTLTSLAFALEHAARHPGLRRVLYVIPFTSIVEQTAEVFRAALGDDAVLEHHSAFDPGPAAAKGAGTDDEARDGGAKLRLAAENWDAPVVVTTAVQFFESLFAARPARCRKLHNIAGSVIVLDEAQTLPLPFLRPCLEALRTLAADYGCSVVLCTATQPAVRAQDGFDDGLEDVRELAPDPEELHDELKRVTVTRCPEPLGVEDLADRLEKDGTALVIVNNRRHARDLFRALKRRHAPGARLLTTALCAAHRRAVLAAVRDDLVHKRPVLLVATSLIEAGVDVDFPVVYRAFAGLDSIAQAAGRCNRHGHLGREGGRVFIFEPAPDEGHEPPGELKPLIDAARDILRIAGDADPLGLDVLHAYFDRVYWQRAGNWRQGTCRLDSAEVGGHKGILAALLECDRSLDIPYADIAAAFRIIADTQLPVIVPYGPAAAEIAALLDRLDHAPLPGAIARGLQPYLVQIPRSARDRLLRAGAAHPVRPDRFGEQFVVLDNGDLYDTESGLDWDDPEYRSVERGLF
ncbi:CRISPR-associated helicase/endonuclease Cas3 [Azospirillum halopraeferens]|uniref:CRISPR-associated helicase/endonuclease Cas3 n=1 Tax=Azospirillum halopraeferens TaxID=34010 RepID=UPI00041158C0|nr:CRISPR-associated helicase/endonuclease Cas3 [Azospirillum halopraeferens]